MTPTIKARSEGGHLFVPRRWHRPKILKWLRRTHAWFGVWGAVLGLLFGTTGILLNHRATLKIPAAKNVETRTRVDLPASLENPEQLGRFLQETLKIEREPSRTRKEPAKPVAWGEGKITQPERWEVSFVSSHETVTAEYWAGDRHASVRRVDPNTFGWLTNLHKGTGAGVGWILLVDTLAGALLVLCLSGLLLWTRLHGPRLAALGLIGVCVSLALTFIFTGW